MLSSLVVMAEPCDSIGSPERYDIEIDLGQAYVGGICILVRSAEGVRGSIINEFGVSAMDFAYDASSDRVRIGSLLGKLDKWYIRRTLRQDLRHLLHNMDSGQYSYHNSKRNIHYTLTPIIQPPSTDETP